MSNPAISVIIPFYGSKSDLEKCLNGLCVQDFLYPFEIIILESGHDPEVSIMTAKFSNIYLKSSYNIMTPGLARNLGVEKSCSSYLAFIDADCVPAQSWLSEIFKLLQQYEVVIGPVLNLYPLHPVASVDNLLQFVDFQKHRDSEITHFPACNLGIRKELFIKTNGFPEHLITGEDIVFSESAIRTSGRGIFYNSHQIVKHSGRRKFAQFIKHNELLGFNRGYFNLKLGRVRKPNGNLLLQSLYYGLRRLVYILVKTIQWNPAGVLRILVYFPFVIVGLYSWSRGFYNGIRKHTSHESALVTDWHKGYK